MWANYFELISPPDLLLYRYSVQITARASGKGKSRELTGKKLNQAFRLILDLPPFEHHRKDICTDFKAQLISRFEFDEDALRTVPDQIQYRAEGEDEAQIDAPYYNVAVVPTGTVTISELTDYLTSTNPRATFDKQPVLQALNIFLGHYTKASPAYATIGSGRSFAVDPDNDVFADLGAGLRAIRGFFSSVRVATARILVNVNVSHAPFYDPLPLHLSMEAFAAAYGPNKIKLQSFLKKVRVTPTHLKPRKNKAGREIQKVKTIFALATRNDGRGPESGGSVPSQVSDFGAGPKDVKFWLSNAPAEGSAPSAPGACKSGKKGKGKPPVGGSGRGGPPSGDSGRYISVADHFLNSRSYRLPFSRFHVKIAYKSRLQHTD